LFRRALGAPEENDREIDDGERPERRSRGDERGRHRVTLSLSVIFSPSEHGDPGVLIA
jgi:hypothetical protein